MLSFLRYTIILIGLTLILIGVSAFVASAYFEQIIMQKVEDAVSATFASRAEVKSVAISPINRSLELRGFTLANPSDYKSGTAIACKTIELRFQPKTLFTDSPVIRSVTFRDTDVYYRHKVGRGSNIKVLSERAAQSAVLAGPDAYPKLIVESVHCEDARIHFSTNAVPFANMGMNLVDVHLIKLQSAEISSTRTVASVFLRSLAKEIVTLKGLLSPATDEVRQGISSISEKVSPG